MPVAPEIAEAIKQMQAAGGIQSYLLYALVAFCLAVVGFLCRDYAKNHERMILAIERSNKESRLTRKMIRMFMSKGDVKKIIIPFNSAKACEDHVREKVGT